MAIGRINGDHINGFFSREMYGRFAGPKKRGRKAGFHGGQE